MSWGIAKHRPHQYLRLQSNDIVIHNAKYKIPTERDVRGRLSARASIPGLTRVQAPQGRTRVNPGIDARADNGPSTSLKVGIRFIRSFSILTRL